MLEMYLMVAKNNDISYKISTVHVKEEIIFFLSSPALSVRYQKYVISIDIDMTFNYSTKRHTALLIYTHTHTHSFLDRIICYIN